MFSFKKIYNLLFLLSLFPVQIFGILIVGFADELMCAFLLLLAGFDIYSNGLGTLRNYKFLLYAIAIMAFYALYSLLFCHFNTPKAVISDFIVQLKPYIAFGVTYGLGTSLTGKTKGWLRLGAIFNTLFLLLTIYFWHPDHYIFGLPANFGAVIMLSSWTFVYGSLDDDGQLDSRNKLIAFFILLIGLLCTRSKYYGEFLLMVFLLFGYRSGMQRNISLRSVLVVFLLFALVVVVAWQKINYYFVVGSNDVFEAAADDASMADNFARPVLYAVAGVLLLDFIPFGTGLASYASFASSDSYSQLYYDYGVYLVHGLSPSYPAFICDAYYPTLAQFGILGVILFFGFWYWIAKKLNRMEKERGVSFRYKYIIGIMVIAFVFIESIASTFFVQGHGMLAMMFLGLILSDKTASDGKQ